MNETLPPIALSRVPLFRGLDSRQLQMIQRSVREKFFQKGEILFYDGKPCDQIVILRSGRVKIFRTASTGREQILEVLSPGDTCACNPGGTTWCCSSSSQALTDCSVWILPREKYTHLVQTNSRLAHSLNELFAKRLRKFSSLIEEVSLDDPKRRLVKFILDVSAPENKFSQPNNSLDLPFTHEEIAQRLGLVRETVSRHLQQLKRAKLIDVKARQIVVLDKHGLQTILG